MNNGKHMTSIITGRPSGLALYITEGANERNIPCKNCVKPLSEWGVSFCRSYNCWVGFGLGYKWLKTRSSGVQSVAYLLLWELGNVPLPFLDFSNNLADAPPPLPEVIFCEKIIGDLSERRQLRYTFLWVQTNVSLIFF